LDDHGENGMDVIRNIKKMYSKSDGHVHVLAASIRSVDHLLAAFAAGSDLVTVPAKVLEEWATKGFSMPDKSFHYKTVDAAGQPLREIAYKELSLDQPWQSFNIAHDLTNAGIQKFVADYRATLKRSAEFPLYELATRNGRRSNDCRAVNSCSSLYGRGELLFRLAK